MSNKHLIPIYTALFVYWLATHNIAGAIITLIVALIVTYKK